MSIPAFQTEDGKTVRSHTNFVQIEVQIEGERFTDDIPGAVEVEVKLGVKYKYYQGFPSTHFDPGDEPEIACLGIVGIEYFIAGHRWELPGSASLASGIFDWCAEQLEIEGTHTHSEFVEAVAEAISRK